MHQCVLHDAELKQSVRAQSAVCSKHTFENSELRESMEGSKGKAVVNKWFTGMQTVAASYEHTITNTYEYSITTVHLSL